MKAIAIVELPDDAFELEAWGDGKWIITDEGEIRYLEDENSWLHYKDIDVDGIELKPMPEKKETFDGRLTYDKLAEYIVYNKCIEEILGENND